MIPLYGGDRGCAKTLGRQQVNDSIERSEHTTADRKTIRKVLRIDSSAQRENSVTRASGYLKQVLRFIGIEDVRLIGAEGVASDAELAKEKALSVLDEWLPDPVGQVA